MLAIGVLLVCASSARVVHTSTAARTAAAGYPQPRRIARISRQVFGPRWRVAACIAHYESTDGASLYGAGSLGPWQIQWSYHQWADRWRLVNDWLYSAKVAYHISAGGRDWSAWTTHARCGA